ncbi:LADA_0H08372g1_1 [Lachancea dasiensis]|uniref:LADA_0H08372g1_1 n=1 Tax=Lachancea dasiensis TaxID=1072105 RepID=A0A1G4K2G4_9SACH|nr:LADA_0H08372g1_1 [Lachancea dasiensis]
MGKLDDYVPMIDAILSASNPDEVSAKRIRKAIQELFAVDLEPQRKKVNALIVERFDQIQESRTQISHQDLVDKDVAVADKLLEKVNGSSSRSKSNGKISKPRKKRKASEAGNALSQNKMLLSPELQELVKEPEMARTQVVKKIWEYIKEHNLQNPADRREILCDEKLKPVFGDKTTMFALNKSLSRHIFNSQNKDQQSLSSAEDLTAENSASGRGSPKKLPSVDESTSEAAD